MHVTLPAAEEPWMRVAAVQHDVVWEDAAATRARLAPMVAAAAAAGARLVVLTEMFATGFTMRPGELAEPQDGPSAGWLAERAAEHDVWLIASLPVRADDGGFLNRLLVVGPDGTRHHYDKRRPFGPEQRHYTAGGASVTVDVEGLAVTPFVCYDLRFADLLWDAAEQTDCYVVPANWPEVRASHWDALLVARAIENQAYVVGVNRVGEGGGLRYAGGSRVVDPLGRTLALGAHGETILLADVDRTRVVEVRRDLPFLADRRP